MSDVRRASGSRPRIRATLVAAMLVALLAPVSVVSAHHGPARTRQGSLLRLRRPPPGRVAEVRGAGPDADDERVPQARRLRVGRRPPDRRRRPTPARAGTRWRPAPGRASTDRPTTRSTSTASRSPIRTAAFDPNVLQVETIAQSAERGGLKVAQVEWAGGRNATIHGPTIDFQSLLLGPRRGDELHRDGRRRPVRRRRPFIASFGLQFDTPAGYRRPGAVPAGGARARRRLDQRPDVATARPRRCACASSTPASTSTGSTPTSSTAPTTARVNYDRVLFSPTKDGADSVGTLRKGQWADVKVKIVGGALDGKTAGMLVKVEELTGDLSRVRLFHTSVSRADATLADMARRVRVHRRLRRVPRPEVPDLDRRRLRHPRGRRSRARRRTSSRACTGRPATCRCSNTWSRPTSPTC